VPQRVRLRMPSYVPLAHFFQLNNGLCEILRNSYEMLW
jgi:hypothetical protein